MTTRPVAGVMQGQMAPESMMLDEFYYRLPWQVEGAFPGNHGSRHSGSGTRFRGLSPLLRHPDPRRIDLRASLRDPFESLQVRVMQQRSRSQVFVVGDLSASMGSGVKLALLRQIAVACAWSAWRAGDSVGFAGCSETLREELVIPNAVGVHVATELHQRLTSVVAAGANANGLLKLPEVLPSQRALVFLISDFFLPRVLLSETLALLARHMVVPVVIEQTSDCSLPERFGLSRVRDRESGEERLLVLTRALRQRLRDAYAKWREGVQMTCMRHAARPFVVRDQFDAARLTDYFLQLA